jgi:radical SAM PhpK family P-methyltransferase
MQKTIDCLFIGHNEVDFEKYVDNIKEMGVNSGAYRDLNLSFLRYDNCYYHATGIFNLLCRDNAVGEGESFSATIAYLGTYLERRGFSFDYIHSFQAEKEELKKKLEQENILSIAVTTTLYVTFFPVLEIVNFIRRYNRSAVILIGGPFISTQCRVSDSITLEYLFKSLDADFYVNSSQGESTLVRLLHALKNNGPTADINNIYYKSGDRYVSTPISKENNKLSRNLVKWDLFSDRIGEYVNLRTSISCPFSCAFCGFPQHAGAYQTAEIEAGEYELNLLKQTGVKSLHFVDDTLNVPVKRFKELLRMMIKNKYGFRWHSQFRCQFADEETVALMKESGCEGVFLGLESGNDQILKNMNKNASVEKYREGIALLKQYEIITHGSFIIGFPGETHETVQDSIRLIEESQIDYYRAQLWYCEPVTPIWKQREKYRIRGSHFEWSHATMNAREACRLVEKMFLTIETSTWLPQYGFDFDNLFHLSNRAIDWDKIKNFIRCFNEGIKEKLINPSLTEVSAEMMDRIKNALNPDKGHYPAVMTDKPEEKGEDLIIDFELD